MSTRVATYYRISADPEGLKEGVDRQRADCQARVAREGWTLLDGDEFEENDVSASTNSRKARPKYAEMLRRARAGDFDVILAYSNSRLTRRPMELEDLIVLSESHGVKIRTIVSGDIDLGTANGRAIARTLAAWDANEAEQTSERARRAKVAKKARGEYAGGARRFGFGKPHIVTKADGKVILSATDRNSVNEREAAIIRTGVASVIAGNSVASVVRDWNVSGVTGVRGAVWRRNQVRDILTEPANVPAIIDAESLATVTAILNDNARKHTRGSEPKHFLSGVIECSICGERFGYYKKSDAPRAYRCVNRHNAVQGDAAEAVVSSAVAQWYASGKKDPVQHDRASRTIPEVYKELAAITAELDEIQEGINAGDLRYAKVKGRIQALRDQAAPLHDELEQLRQSDAHEALTEAAVIDAEQALTADLTLSDPNAAPFARAVLIRKRWDGMSVESKKKLLAANFKVVVTPSHKGHFGRDRVHVSRHGIDLTSGDEI
jgi:site-specific DNA recombinase